MPVTRQPSLVANKLRDAVRQHRAGALDAAASLYAEALSLDPDHADALHLSGVAAYQRDRHEEAIQLISRAIERAPAIPDFPHSRGLARRATGDLAGAEADFARAVALNPDYLAAWINLGLTRLQLTRVLPAIDAFRRAVKLAPESAEAQAYLGTALLKDNRGAEAAVSLKLAVAAQPDFAEAHYNLGLALQRSGDTAGAEKAWRQAIAANPFYLKPWNNLAQALRDRGLVAEARGLFERALSQSGADTPDAAELWNNFANLLDSVGEAEKAIDAYHRAVALAPRHPELRANFGSALLGIGQVSVALSHLRQALDLAPDQPDTVHPYLLGLLYREDTDALMLSTAKSWAARFKAAPPARYLNDRNPEKRLRIGYVSPDFCRHVVMHFSEPVLEAHDGSAVEIFCYANVLRPDDVTQRFRALADHWRDTRMMSDAALAATIHADQVDILVDLAGHTVGSRLSMFAYRPAPIQMTWLGYPATTGLSQIDWRITDDASDPIGMTEEQYTERLLRLPGGFNVYRPPVDLPDVAPLPALTSGHVTFGSFNHAAKITDEALDLWAALLARVPGSRLLIKNRGCDIESVRAGYLDRLIRHGIAADRIELLRSIPEARGHLSAYNRVDIALDSFPYNGTTTTCESLLMGVPVVGLEGRSHRARVGVSLLSRIGLADLVAADPASYVDAAARLAGDLPALAQRRAGLRQRFLTSSVCDATALTRRLEQAYRMVWKNWCEAAS